MKKPSILFESPTWPASLSSNGVSKYVDRVIRPLSNLGVSSYIFTHRLHAEYNDNQIAYEIGSKPRNLIDKIHRKIYPSHYSKARFVQSATSAIHRHNIDLIEMEEARGDSLYLAGRTGVPIALRLHGPWFLNGAALGLIQDEKYKARVMREGIAIRQATAISAPSQDVINRTSQFYGIDLKNAVCIPNPIEIPSPHLCWSFPNCNRNKILFVGRIDLHKGADIFIKAFLEISREHPNLEATIVGPDRGILLENGVTVGYNDFIAPLLTNQSPPKISYLGELNQEEILRLRQSALITVAPSRYDNFPYTVLESLAQGCPTLSSDSGGASEMITDGYNGLLFRSGSTEHLVKRLKHALSNIETLSQIGISARDSVIRRYSSEIVANQLYEFYLSNAK